jgi:hypothetical protein
VELRYALSDSTIDPPSLIEGGLNLLFVVSSYIYEELAGLDACRSSKLCNAPRNRAVMQKSTPTGERLDSLKTLALSQCNPPQSCPRSKFACVRLRIAPPAACRVPLTTSRPGKSPKRFCQDSDNGSSHTTGGATRPHHALTSAGASVGTAASSAAFALAAFSASRSATFFFSRSR